MSIATSHEIVIPDCCNIGVVFRTLIVVNGFVLAVNCVLEHAFWAGLMAFIDASILVEMVSLSSLLALCAVRRFVGARPLWLQRLVCAGIPAVIAALIIRFVFSKDMLLGNFTRLSVMEGMLIGSTFGILLQHYFELRNRAFSPALAEARLQALQARIRPHFLFNSLNAVLSLIRTEPRRAEMTLEDLADLFRVLMRDTRDTTSIEDEVKLCKQYLSIEKIRLGERLQVEWDLTEVTEDVLRKARIPVLLLQPLLENAVHYGVEPSSEPVLIQVRISRMLDRIEITVVNPVSAPVSDLASSFHGNHMALENIRERLRLLHDVEAQLNTQAVRGFFEVRMRFPYVKSMPK